MDASSNEDRSIIWQKKDSWRLERVELTDPNGRIVESACVRHPGAAVLVPVTAEGNIVMIRQYRLPIDQFILEVPAGTREWGEDWLICAQRELREETGFRAERFDAVGEFWPGPSFSDEVLSVFIARDLSHDPLPMDFDEQIEVVEFPLDQLVEMALDGRIKDGKTIIALLRANAWLKKNG